MTADSTLLAAQRSLQASCRHPMGSFVPFGPEDAEQSIPARFAQQARAHGSRPAVVTRAGTLTYAGLDRATNRVASALAARRDPDGIVALLFEHGSSAIVGLLGALKAGRGYVFLDPTLPPARLSLLLEDSQAAVVVTNGVNRALARALMPVADGVLEIDAPGRPGGDAAPVVEIGPDRLFGLIYTSGSTGQPKGVVHDHRNILNTVGKYINAMGICPEDRVTLLASCSFNMALLGTFGALLTGAALYPFDLKAEGAGRLPAWLRDEGITIYHSVPTVLRQLLDALPVGANLPRLRAICLGGEAVYRRDVARYQERFSPGCLLLHGLGCTELSMIRQYVIAPGTPLGEGRVPIGYPIADRDVLIVDGAGQPVPPGETGEIVLRSRYMALGYWRQPDLTRATFPPDPGGGAQRLYRTGDLGFVTADGCLTHLGRQDFQVKIRGHRVEVEEIELALLEIAGVREAVVTAREDHAGEPRLVAYVVPAARPAPAPGALRAALADKLPDYMVPSAFVALDELPLTDTGKIDRRALPAPGRARPALPEPPASPRTPVEERLAAIWTEVLALDEVGIHDEFLALGGNSLRASLILSRVRHEFRTDISQAAFLAAATIAQMAVAIAQSHPIIGGLLADLETRSNPHEQGTNPRA